MNTKLKIHSTRPGCVATGHRPTKLVSLLLAWYAANARDLPWRRTRDPYAIWVSEIMLQQTQVRTVMPYWERWMRELPTIEAVAAASSDKIHKLWEGLGYYSRARNLQKAAQVLVENSRGDQSRFKIGNRPSPIGDEKRNGQAAGCSFPDTFDEVLALPGIGRYTAGAICSIAFNQPTPILDGNVIRVLTRIFGIDGNPKEKATNQLLWELAEQLVTRAKVANLRTSRPNSATPMATNGRDDFCCSHLNQSLMELGALVCTPRNPSCLVCPARKICSALNENRIDALPNLGERQKPTARRFVAFIVECEGTFLVRQRPAGVVNAHLWEFPNVEVAAPFGGPQRRLGNGVPSDSAATALKELLRVTDPRSLALRPLGALKHSITRYRITVEAFHVRVPKPPRGVAGRWLSPSQFNSLAFTAAHKKLASLAAKAILSGP